MNNKSQLSSDQKKKSKNFEENFENYSSSPRESLPHEQDKVSPFQHGFGTPQSGITFKGFDNSTNYGSLKQKTTKSEIHVTTKEYSYYL